MTLRPIDRSCAETFRAVRLRALQDTPSAFGSTYAKESQLSNAEWAERASQRNGDRSAGYLAWDGDEACGIVVGFLDQDEPAKANLVSMWVAPTHRGRGVGRMLVNAVTEWARSRRVATLCLMVTSNNDVATRFYEQLGFTRTGRTEPYPNDPELFEFEMIRLIDQPSPGDADLSP